MLLVPTDALHVNTWSIFCTEGNGLLRDAAAGEFGRHVSVSVMPDRAVKVLITAVGFCFVCLFLLFNNT